MRVHRSFIVNLQKVKTIERNCIVFGKEYIPISDSYKSNFMEYLKSIYFKTLLTHTNTEKTEGMTDKKEIDLFCYFCFIYRL